MIIIFLAVLYFYVWAGLMGQAYENSIIPFIIFLAVVFLLKYGYEIIYMKKYFYDIQKNSLIIKKGVFSVNEITLPIKKIQDVYVDQDILDRIFGLYDIHVSSATIISGNLSHIDGLNKSNSEKIKNILLKNLRKHE